MNKIYHLGSCTTCQAIIKSTGLTHKGILMQDIKTEKITPDQIDEMKQLCGSYEALFSKKAIKYRTLGLKNKLLGEKDYRDLILQEYTFLKRPVIILGNRIYIGNDKKTIAAVSAALK